MKASKPAGSAPLTPQLNTAPLKERDIESAVALAEPAMSRDRMALTGAGEAGKVKIPAGDIATLQRKLLKLGYQPTLAGDLDDQTKEAITNFQKAKGLPTTGAADQATLALVDQQVDAKVNAFVPNPSDPFLKKLVPAALEVEKTYGIPAAVTLAQAALESDSGKSAIGEYNVFGIKGEGSKGSLKVWTREYWHGHWRKVQANFAHFASYQEALQAHAELFYNGGYGKALKQLNNPQAFARALTGVYATDPRYGQHLMRIMKEQHLAPPEPKPAPKAKPAHHPASHPSTRHPKH